jgi:hypothetical protein
MASQLKSLEAAVYPRPPAHAADRVPETAQDRRAQLALLWESNALLTAPGKPVPANPQDPRAIGHKIALACNVAPEHLAGRHYATQEWAMEAVCQRICGVTQQELTHSQRPRLRVLAGTAEKGA